jgi:hypothetical protein
VEVSPPLIYINQYLSEANTADIMPFLECEIAILLLLLRLKTDHLGVMPLLQYLSNAFYQLPN